MLFGITSRTKLLIATLGASEHFLGPIRDRAGKAKLDNPRIQGGGGGRRRRTTFYGLAFQKGAVAGEKLTRLPDRSVSKPRLPARSLQQPQTISKASLWELVWLAT